MQHDVNFPLVASFLASFAANLPFKLEWNLRPKTCSNFGILIGIIHPYIEILRGGCIVFHVFHPRKIGMIHLQLFNILAVGAYLCQQEALAKSTLQGGL